MFESGEATLIISNEEMNDIIKIIKSLEESGLLIKDVTETIKNEAEKQKGKFLSMSLGTVELITGKGTVRVGEGTFRAVQGY